MDHHHPQRPPLKPQKKFSPFNVPSPLSSSSSKTNKKTRKRTLRTNKKTNYLSCSLSKEKRRSKKQRSRNFYLIMRRKCRTIGEIAVMELADAGVRTGATAATETVHKKRRRSNGHEEAEYKVTSSTTSYIQLRNRRILVDHYRRRDENRFLSTNSDHDDDVSCCSSNSRSGEKRIIELPDLEEESIEVEASTQFSSRESWKETTPSSEARAEKPENLDSTSSTPSEANSRRRSTVEKMPTEAEIEEFFSAAEKKLHKEFAEKYNYDIVKDEPLEGRYEWVGLKP